MATGRGFGEAVIHYRKSYEVVGWSYNGALYCVDHAPPIPDDCGQGDHDASECVAVTHNPKNTNVVTVISATGVSQGVLDGNSIIDVPQPVFLDQVTAHDVCDLCLIPLDA